MQLHPIGYIHSDYPSKFGIPRQSGLAASSRSCIVFEPDYQNPDCFRGIEEYSHLWLIWGFSGNRHERWTPTVRPPRLGGNQRVGVFATRSPFRPNRLGLSSVELDRLETDARRGPLLWVRGADLMDGTPIYDIKPYLAFTDSHPGASGSFADTGLSHRLQVQCDPALLSALPIDKQRALLDTLALDPRPSYQQDPSRIYGMSYAGFEVRFCVDGNVLTVREISATDCVL